MVNGRLTAITAWLKGVRHQSHEQQRSPNETNYMWNFGTFAQVI